MADTIKGLNKAAPVVPYTELDLHPTHFARYGNGGSREVASKAERNAIPYPRLSLYMSVTTQDDGVEYRLKNMPASGQLTTDANWEVKQAASGPAAATGLPYYKESVDSAFRHADGESVIFMLDDGYGWNYGYNPTGGNGIWQIYRRRILSPYPGNVVVHPYYDDLFGQYWDLVSPKDFSVQHEVVHNATDAAIPTGTPVFITGSVTGPNNTRVWSVAPCQASDAAKLPCFGVVIAQPGFAIAAGGYGRITQKGTFLTWRSNQINTDGWEVGDTIYVSETAGTLTNIRPASNVQEVGIVLDLTDFYSSRILIDIKPPIGLRADYKVLIQPITNIEEEIESACILKRVWFASTLTTLQIQINGGAIQTLAPVNRVWNGAIAIPTGAKIKWIPTASASNTSWTYTTE